MQYGFGRKAFEATIKMVQSYLFVLLVAMALGLFSPYAVYVTPYTTKLLIAIFFLSSLKIDFREAARHFTDNKRVLVTVTAWMLLVRPAIVYWLVRPFSPDLALGLMILSSMPTGMTSPLLTEMVGGKHSLALVLTVISSLLAPFTIPAVIKLLAGAAVTVSFMAMFISLAKVIFIPFVAAQVVRMIWPKTVAKAVPMFKMPSIVMLGFLIMGVVASRSEAILGGVNGPFGASIIALFVLFIAFHFAGYWLTFWRGKNERVTVTVCATYLNMTLAIYLAGQFFTDQRVFMPAVLTVLPWSLLMPPFQYAVKKWHLGGK